MNFFRSCYFLDQDCYKNYKSDLYNEKEQIWVRINVIDGLCNIYKCIKQNN